MQNIYLNHPFDLDSGMEELAFFAEELHGSQDHALPSNSLSTLGCECGLSTFFCYGCGADVVAQSEGADSVAFPDRGGIEHLEASLKWARERMDDPTDKVGDALREAFRSGGSTS